jgi:hypothetical protein
VQRRSLPDHEIAQRVAAPIHLFAFSAAGGRRDQQIFADGSD